MTTDRYLVVYEDEYMNKESELTTKIGTTLKKIIDSCEWLSDNEIDFAKYDSDKPYDAGTFGNGFYDIELFDKDENYQGRFMIFYVDTITIDNND